MSFEFTYDDPNNRAVPPSKFLQRYRDRAAVAVAFPPARRHDFDEHLLNWIADTRNLKPAWDYMKRKASRGAGPDGLTVADFTRASAWELINQLRDELMAGEYEHGPLRSCLIPKRPMSKYLRELLIANLRDRVVARAALQILEPILGPQFHVYNLCRASRGRQHALAYAHWFVEHEARTVCIVEDLENAYDSVPKQRLLQIIQKYMNNDGVLRLLEQFLGAKGCKGIPQGSPISLLLMNFYADYFIAKPWHKLHPTVPLLRHVDDMNILCSPADDPERLYADLEKLVQDAGFKLKVGKDEAIRDLRLASISWLGYEVAMRRGEIQVRSAWTQGGEKWEERLADRFVRLHDHPNAAERAPLVMQNTVIQSGPSFPFTNTKAAYKLLAKAAKAAAFDEIPDYKSIHERWSNAYDRWLAKKGDIFAEREQVDQNRQLALESNRASGAPLVPSQPLTTPPLPW